MSNIPKDKWHFIEGQNIDLSHLTLQGTILDIGGGGEGIIGQMFKSQVVAIDRSKSELEESAEGPLKVIMDASDLKFLDHTFDYVSTFFTMMYISKKDHSKVFQEAYRVLKNGGEFFLWDVTIGDRDPSKELFVVPLKVDLGNEIVETGYGAIWESSKQDLEYYAGLAEEVGFKIIEKEQLDSTYKLVLKKL